MCVGGGGGSGGQPPYSLHQDGSHLLHNTHMDGVHQRYHQSISAHSVLAGQLWQRGKLQHTHLVEDSPGSECVGVLPLHPQ